MCSCISNVSTEATGDTVEATLEALLAESIQHSQGSIEGLTLSITGPNFEWAGSNGFDSKSKEDSIYTDQPFRIASVTKTYTAVAILRLHEMDSLSIDDPISQYISENHSTILQKGGYDPDQITLRHCLHHTAGFYNYARVDNSFADILMSNPDKRWTRTEQLQGAMDWGEKAGEPGEKYSYCDTGYILLGEIIGTYFNGDYAAGLRQLLKYDALGLQSTWMESLEPSPLDTIAPVHRYFGSTDVTETDPSIDLYGGGGLKSTCSDIGLFVQSLFNEKVFEKKETLKLMLSPASYSDSYDFENDRRYEDYRQGIIRIPVFGEDAYTHSGFWGTLYVHVPYQNTTYTVNCNRRLAQRVVKKAILTMDNYYASTN